MKKLKIDTQVTFIKLLAVFPSPVMLFSYLKNLVLALLIKQIQMSTRETAKISENN